MTEIHCRELVGAYAVGALEPPEAAVLADHLLTCLRCRHVLAEAEETAAVLAAVPPEMFLDEPASLNDPLLHRTLQAIRLEAATRPQLANSVHAQAGPMLVNQRPPAAPIPRQAAASGSGGFPGWSGQTARSHRRRAQASSVTEQQRRYKLVGAAAAAVLVLGGGVMIGSKLGGTEPTTSPTQAAAIRTAAPTPAPTTGVRTYQGSSSTTGVSATINVTSSNGQVRISGTVTGVKAGQECRLYAVSDIANPILVRSWTMGASGTFDVTTSVDPQHLAAFRILNATNKVLVIAHS